MNRILRTVYTALLLCIYATASAYDTPIMGWSSWNTYRVNISDSLICSQADALVSSGLRDAGYTYINIDDGFFGGRDSTGVLIMHPERFPNGMHPVVDHIHRLGLKAGIYSDAGRNTCGNFWDADSIAKGVGLYGHDTEDSRLYFSDLGFDFIKVDFCGGDPRQNIDSLCLDERTRYTAIRRTIDSLGHSDVKLNVCRWNFPGTWVTEVASSWRISPDISPSWGSVRGIIAENRYLSAYARNGKFNDMDMLEIGRGLSDAEERSHFGIWCIQSSPLLIGCDLTAIPEASLLLLSNPELIALNQDTLALQAYIAKVQNGVYVYVKDVERLHSTTRAIAVYNPADTAAEISLDMRDIDLSGKIHVRDLFNRLDLPDVTDGNIHLTIDPHDTAIMRLEADCRLERSVYEAETAWLPLYEEIGRNPAIGHACYSEDQSCSGGAKVEYAGGNADNVISWLDVHSFEGGEYTATIYYQPEAEDIQGMLTINGTHTIPVLLNAKERSCKVKIRLSPGVNSVTLGNPIRFLPAIDRIILSAVNQ